VLKERMPQALALVALIAALGASVLLVFIPFYSGVETNPATGQQVQGSATLIQMNGWDVLIPLVIPPVLAAAGLLAVLCAKHWRLLFVWIAASLLAVFVFLTGFSIGLFYVPAMIVSMTCAIVTQFQGNTIVR